jgi:hypothetical protein
MTIVADTPVVVAVTVEPLNVTWAAFCWVQSVPPVQAVVLFVRTAKAPELVFAPAPGRTSHAILLGMVALKGVPKSSVIRHSFFRVWLMLECARIRLLEGAAGWVDAADKVLLDLVNRAASTPQWNL